jgi:hypothetical protein
MFFTVLETNYERHGSWKQWELGRDFNLALRLCKDSMEKNWLPSVYTINWLLNGLMVISRNAREITNLVTGRKPSCSDDENGGLQRHLLSQS